MDKKNKPVLSRAMLAAASFAFIAVSCSVLPDVSRAELAQIIERDAKAFSVLNISEEVLDRLSAYRVVLVGETHHLREHREFMAELVKRMYERGFRQLLMEWPHFADWILADFVGDGGLMPGWEPPVVLGGELISAIRDFNRSLPEDEQFRVRAIDVNLEDYGGASSFRNVLGAIASTLPSAGPLEAFQQGDYSTPEKQTDLLNILKARLEADRPDLLVSWGADMYQTVFEMVEVELASVPIRSMREDDYDRSARLREEAIKDLVDLRLAEGSSFGTLINIGLRHAQKKHLMGTSQEWLGDHLVHQSDAAGGSVIVLTVTAALIWPDGGGTIPKYDLSSSPENELFRVMNESKADQIVFFPVDDPVFRTGRVRMNFEGDLYKAPPKAHFDVFVLLREAHRDPGR